MIARRGELPRCSNRGAGSSGCSKCRGRETTIETAIEPGDRVLIYTDGLTENFTSSGNVGVEGLAEIVRDAANCPCQR